MPSARLMDRPEVHARGGESLWHRGVGGPSSQRWSTQKVAGWLCQGPDEGAFPPAGSRSAGFDKLDEIPGVVADEEDLDVIVDTHVPHDVGAEVSEPVL